MPHKQLSQNEMLRGNFNYPDTGIKMKQQETKDAHTNTLGFAEGETYGKLDISHIIEAIKAK